MRCKDSIATHTINVLVVAKVPSRYAPDATAIRNLVERLPSYVRVFFKNNLPQFFDILTAVLDTDPHVVVFWEGHSQFLWYGPYLSYLAPAYPDMPIFAGGCLYPAVSHAAHALARAPYLSGVLWGDTAEALLVLCESLSSSRRPQAPWSKQLEHQCSNPARGGIQFGSRWEKRSAPIFRSSDRVPELSPFVAPVVSDTAGWLEILRGHFPFSPIPLDMQPEPPHRVRLEVIQEALERMERDQVSVVQLGPNPVDTDPVHLKGVLEWIAAKGTSTTLELPLRRLPDRSDLDLLHAARVGGIVLDPFESPDAASFDLTTIDRSLINLLVDSGISVVVRYPIGFPSDCRANQRRALEYFFTSKATSIRLEPLRLWPGHPWQPGWSSRPSEVGAASSSLTLSNAPSFEVLGTPQMPLERSIELRPWSLALETLLISFPHTLQTLSQLSQTPKLPLLERFFEVNAPRFKYFTTPGRSPVPLFSILKNLWLDFFHALVHEANVPDLLPLLRSVLNFDLWLVKKVANAHMLPPIETPPEALRWGIVARYPDVDVRAFPYNIQRLTAKLPLDGVALHRSFIYVRRRPLQPPILGTLNEPLYDILAQLKRPQPVSYWLRKDSLAKDQGGVLRPSSDDQITLQWIQQLLDMRLIYLTRLSESRPDDPASFYKKVLSFPTNLAFGRKRKPREDSHDTTPDSSLPRKSEDSGDATEPS